MTKNVYVILMALAMVFSFSNCSKDELDLVGTSWAYQDEDGWTQTINFTSKTELTIKVEANVTTRSSDSGSTITGVYTLNGSNITITVLTVTIKGVISGNKMTFTDEDGEKTVYTKK